MAQRSESFGGSSRRRGPAPKVRKPVPWGMVAVSAVLTLFLGGILAYAIANQGEGFIDPMERITGIEGVVVVPPDQIKNGHVEGPVRYAQRPPNNGEHNATPQTCGVYTAAIPDEHAVHSLEHGAVWITYKPDLPKDQVERLTDLVEGEPYMLLSPYPEQASPINLSAWGMRLSVNSASDDRVEEFANAAANGPQAPEKGAACSGTNATGPISQPQIQPPRPTGAPTARTTIQAPTAPGRVSASPAAS